MRAVGVNPNGGKRTQILIADDHELIRRGLRIALQSHPGWTVCAECANGRDAVDEAKTLRPDVAVLDIAMPELNGIDAARQIKRVTPRTEVLLISNHYADHLVREMFAAGVRGFVLKSDADDDVLRAVEYLVQHKPYFTPRAMRLLVSDAADDTVPRPPRELLTPRERELVQMLSEGKSTKEIAVELNVSIKTAETHRANIMRKLNVHSIQEVILYALRNKIVDL